MCLYIYIHIYIYIYISSISIYLQQYINEHIPPAPVSRTQLVVEDAKVGGGGDKVDVGLTRHIKNIIIYRYQNK